MVKSKKRTFDDLIETVPYGTYIQKVMISKKTAYLAILGSFHQGKGETPYEAVLSLMTELRQGKI